MSEPLRVLYIHGGTLARGGTEAYMMNYYRNMDRSKVQIDFVVHGFEKGVYDDEIQSLGGRIYHVPIKTKDPIGNRRELKKIFSSGMYRIVHSHMDAMNAWNLQLAKKCGIPVRISHSHNTAVQTKNKLKLWLNERSRRMLPKVSTHLFACSHLAGNWLYGEKTYTVIPNAVDLTRFAFDPEKRQMIRASLGFDDTDVVLGHVGRFSNQKNHSFFVPLMEKLLNKAENFRLVLIGDGDLKEQIRQGFADRGLLQKVAFIDACPNVADFYHAFDWFCLPSLHEGLPVVGVEAQANGLRCAVADTVSKEVDICGNVVFLPIGEAGLDDWVTALTGAEGNLRDSAVTDKMIAAGYEIKTAAHSLSQRYLQM